MGDKPQYSSAIRRSFLDFYISKGHEEVPSSGLVPQGDPTLLFANAGMNQFKDVFTGKAARARSRATSSQKCVRAGGKHNDLENVGRTARHHTFFEMLGNFSFGDYFKEGAITFAHELLVEVYDLPLDRLIFTVHESDEDARRIWKQVTGVGDDRVISLGDKDNFWAMGDVGPCGPCSEIHFVQGNGNDLPCAEEAAGRRCLGPACDCDRMIEIWNLVFMQFEQQPDGTRTTLPRPSVDTGLGLERLCAVLGGFRSNYETDLLQPMIKQVEALSGKAFDPRDYSSGSTSVSMRAIADHARATAFLIADGVFPEKTGREYVLRRIMRRAAYHGWLLGIGETFLASIADTVIGKMRDVFPELEERRKTILEVTEQEERKFRETLDRGVRILLDESERLSDKTIPGDVAFKLYDTYGFPLDLTRVIAVGRGYAVDEAGFDAKMQEQRKRAEFAGSGEAAVAAVYPAIAARVGESRFLGYERTRAPGRVVALLADGVEVESARAPARIAVVCDQTPFYGESGGQVGDTGTAKGPAGKVVIENTRRPVPGLIVHEGKVSGGEIKVGDTLNLEVDEPRRNAIRRNHSATHLLHWALRTTLGEHVAQKGSLVAPDRLRFDFSHFQPLTTDERAKVETLVNQRILSNAEIKTEQLSLEEARKSGAMAFFGEKYNDTVRVLTMEESKELCGGTHAARTGDIGLFKIADEAGVAQGVRRIEAVTGIGALDFVQKVETALLAAAQKLKTPPLELADKIDRLQHELRDRDREVDKLRGQLASGGGRDLAAQAERVDGIYTLVLDVPVGDAKILRETADTLREKLNPGIVVLTGADGDKLSVVCLVTKDAVGRFHAGKLLGKLLEQIEGKGGGRPDLAQGGGRRPEDLEAVLSGWRSELQRLAASRA